MSCKGTPECACDECFKYKGEAFYYHEPNALNLTEYPQYMPHRQKVTLYKLVTDEHGNKSYAEQIRKGYHP